MEQRYGHETLDLFGGPPRVGGPPATDPPTTDPTAALRAEYAEALKEGACCPVCDRWGHYDGRLLNRTMVRSVAWLWRLSDSGAEWVDVPKALREEGAYDISKQYSTSKHWGLLEAKPKGTDGRRGPTKESGVWRPTLLAGRFLRGSASLPRRVWTFNDRVVAVSDVRVRVGDVAPGFDYWEMMSTPWPEG